MDNLLSFIAYETPRCVILSANVASSAPEEALPHDRYAFKKAAHSLGQRSALIIYHSMNYQLVSRMIDWLALQTDCPA